MWNEALLDVAPERNRQLSRNCYDRDPLDASALSIGSPQEPSGDYAFWLICPVAASHCVIHEPAERDVVQRLGSH